MSVRLAESAFELSNIKLAGLREEEYTQAVDTADRHDAVIVPSLWVLSLRDAKNFEL